MSEPAERRSLDHVVLPRRLPGLALLERYFPSPADNILDAELAAFASQGDTVLDPWAGTGWTARRAIANGMRAVAADPSPFAQLAAQAFLLAPETAALDAAFAQLAASRRVDVPLRQHIEELYATRCAACRRPVMGEQFIWPRDTDAPGRKVYRCPSCDLSVGGPEERVAPMDDTDLAKLGMELAASRRRSERLEPMPVGNEEDLPPAPVGLTGGLAADPLPSLGESGGPPPPEPVTPDPPVGGSTTGGGTPRFQSTVHPEPANPGAATEVRQGPHVQLLRDRFPVLDGHVELADELLALYTPRNLYAIQTIASKIEAEMRDPALLAIFRLALAACLLPASRLNGYPGRVASLRISGGHVRQPASRHQREVNVWQLFESSFRDVRTAIAALGRERRPARFATDVEDLGGMSAANVLWIRSRPAVAGQYLPPDGVDLVLGTPPLPASIDELSFEYLATAWLIGREAAETLRLEPLFGTAPLTSEGAEATALRHAVASATSALRPGGWCNILVEGDDPDRLVTIAVAGAAAGLELEAVIHRQSQRSGDGVAVHLRKPSGEDRLRSAVRPRPLQLGVDAGHLTYPELAAAVDRAAVELLRDRGEPADLTRITCAVLKELAISGLLHRVAHPRNGSEQADNEAATTTGEDVDSGTSRGAADAGEHADRVAGGALLATLLREELWRDDHPRLVRLGDEAHPVWWLREPDLAEQPLADRVEWATFSILTTAGRLDEPAFLDRIFRLFPGLQAPDEELVRSCLGAYARTDAAGQLRTEEELAARFDGHTRMLALVADYGHRLGIRAWISKREQDKRYEGVPLGERLADDERRAYLPLVVRAPAEALGAVDALWYVRGRMTFLIEVEWTAMLGDAILRRGRQIPPSDNQARILLFPGERTDLVRVKLARSPWLRSELERQNWHFLKWQHLETLVARDVASLDALEPMMGLDPLVEGGGEQLTMFGE